MRRAPGGLFDVAVWTPALQTYGAVTHLSVEVFDDDNALAVGPAPSTPLVDVFERHGYDHEPFTDCARQCLAQAPGSRTVVVASSAGLAVVGTSLVLEGAIVGAAVAGYALLDFPQTLLIERLARRGNVPGVNFGTSRGSCSQRRSGVWSSMANCCRCSATRF